MMIFIEKDMDLEQEPDVKLEDVASQACLTENLGILQLTEPSPTKLEHKESGEQDIEEDVSK